MKNILRQSYSNSVLEEKRRKRQAKYERRQARKNKERMRSIFNNIRVK